MPFKEGTFKHDNGFVITVVSGVIMISPNHPLSIRLADLFDAEKWKEMK